ncbi:MFS transporter [Gordoniibacillus kamchatkensis]|uniref:MFS transporter n=1 Tax=Gordoniibacillus kamchatkensis TaxID=1590651 RepID=A0ABR5AIX5_9BACL|nr:MFS transporter [Paenibacillus sp. VKM B-2647]
MTIAGLSLGYFMVMLDMTVLNVALPAIRHDLGGGFAGMQWVVNAYTIAFACLLLTAGALADRLGAKRLFVAGLVLFLAASVLSAASPSLGVLIACRALLGVGGAALVPASLTLIAHHFPAAAERARALGAWAAVSGAALAAGPAAGGLLVDTLGWRTIFLLQVPVALVSIGISLAVLSETARRTQRGFDFAGQLSAIVAVAALTYALVEGEASGWGAPPIVIAYCAAAVAAVCFVRIEARGKQPMLPLALFRNPAFSTAMAAGLAVNFALSGLLFLLTLYFQQARGYSAFTAGLAFLPLTVPTAFNPMLTGRIVGRIGAAAPAAFGFALMAAGTVILLWSDADSSYAITLLALVLTGFGVSFAIPSLLAAVVASVPKEQAGISSGALNASRQLGAVLGVAVLGAVANGSDRFVAGMHASLLATAAVLLGGGVLSLLYFGRSS